VAFTLNLFAQANVGGGRAEVIFSVGGVLRTVQARAMERNRLICGEALAALRKIPASAAQLVIADLPYFQVLERTWDGIGRMRTDTSSGR
jgi:hypothetical protein